MTSWCPAGLKCKGGSRLGSKKVGGVQRRVVSVFLDWLQEKTSTSAWPIRHMSQRNS